MSRWSAPVYSPVCSSDSAAYDRYLSAYTGWTERLREYGQRFVVAGAVDGSYGQRACCGRCLDFGGRIDESEFGGAVGRAGRELWLDDGEIGSVAGGDGGVGGGVGVAAESGEVGASGFSRGDSVHDSGGLAGAAGGADCAPSALGVGEQATLVSGVEGGSGKSVSQGVVVADGVSVGDGSGRSAPAGAGKNWARNQVWKENKRQKKRGRVGRKQEACGVAVAGGVSVGSSQVGYGFFSGVPEESQLRSSRARRLIAENELAEEKARVAAKVLLAVDVDDKIRCERARVVQMTEKNLVSASRSHAALSANGDGFVEGKRVETLVGSAAASSGLLSSISPSSSVSEAEVRALFKRLADVEHKLAEKERALRVANVRLGLDPEGEKEKDEWTVGDNGELLAASLVDEAMPDGYAMLDVYGVPDKVRLIPCHDI